MTGNLRISPVAVSNWRPAPVKGSPVSLRLSGMAAIVQVYRSLDQPESPPRVETRNSKLRHYPVGEFLLTKTEIMLLLS